MTEFVTSGLTRMAYQVRGQGPALLLIHGAEANRHSFDALTLHLSDRFTVIAYDQRDCGETQAPNQPATLTDLADDAHALVCELGFSRVHVFGSSFGGRVAQALSARHPERVDRLVLGSTWPLPHALKELNPQGMTRLQALRSGLPDTAQELAGLFFPEHFLQQHPELRHIFTDVQAGNARTLRRQAAVDSSSSIDWSLLTMPVLLLTGELDKIVPPPLTLGMAAQLLHAQKVVLPDIGHATALQAPDAVAAHLVRFLTAEQSSH
jgi:3-oxoadipate enol-lactonase